MYLIDIPYSPVNLFIFTKEERHLFVSKVQHSFPEWEDDPDNNGMHYQNHIYVEDDETLFHELSHFIFWLIEYMGIQDEDEFKACITAGIIESVNEKIYDERGGNG